MAVESKIVFRSDSSEVRASTGDLKAARAAQLALQSGTSSDPKIAQERARAEGRIGVERAKAEGRVAAERAKYEAKYGLAHQQAVAGVVERRQKAEIALDAKSRAEEARAVARNESRRVAAHARSEAVMAAATQRRQERESFGSGFSLTDLKSGLDMAFSLASRIGEVTYRAGMAVVQAQAFKEDVSRGFAIIAKSDAEGARVMKMANATADFLGQGRADVAGQFLDLLTKGFKPEKVDEITRRLADLSVVDPRANLEGLSRAIGQIAGKGRLQGDELLQLAESGLETGDVYKALAKNLGVDIPRIIKLQEAGKLSSDVAIQGILDAIKGQTGGRAAGEAARAKAREDLSGLIRQIEAIPANLLFDIEVGPGTDKLKTKLREVIDFFGVSSSTGKEAREALGGAFNALAEGLFGVDLSKTSGVTDTLKAVVETVKASKQDLKDFGTALRIIGGAIATVAPLMKFLLPDPATSASWEVIGWVLSDVAGKIGGFATELYNAGSNLLSSFAGGIKSQAQAVIDAVTSTVGGAVSWAKKILGIGSPSRVFIDIGDFTGKGFAIGMAANETAVARAAGDMAGAGVTGASTAGLGSRTSQVSTTTIAATFAPSYQVTALGPKEVEELRALQADDRSKFDAMIRSYMTERANAA